MEFEEGSFVVAFWNFDRRRREIRHSLGALHFENVAYDR